MATDSPMSFEEVEVRFARATCPKCGGNVVLLRHADGPSERLDWITFHAHDSGSARHEHDCGGGPTPSTD